jgi:hypothetical protein
MSLFGDDQYQWRETYFVLFREKHRPPAAKVVESLASDDRRFRVSNVRANRAGLLESLTLKSPDDFSAMDVSYVSGEEVSEQVAELSREITKASLTSEEQGKLKRLSECNARFDVFHFEQVPSADDEGEFLDPAALLIVIERLSRLCHGIGVDPQTGSFM